MAFVTITPEEVAPDALAKASTMDKIRLNLEYLNDERRKAIALYWATLSSS
jgi:hypothetical protein